MKTIVRKIIVRFYYNCYEDDCQKDNNNAINFYYKYHI